MKCIDQPKLFDVIYENIDEIVLSNCHQIQLSFVFIRTQDSALDDIQESHSDTVMILIRTLSDDIQESHAHSVMIKSLFSKLDGVE